MPPEFERRAHQADTEVREARDGKTPVISGHAAVFEQLSGDLGGFREKIAPGAFTKTLQEADVRALWNHDSRYPLGRVSAGTLALREDEVGLAFDLLLPETQYAADLAVLMRRGDVSQMSFGFRAIRDEWHESPIGPIRTLTEVALIEVSPVTFPAYPQTAAQVRAAGMASLYTQACLGTLDRVSWESLRALVDEVAPPVEDQEVHEEHPASPLSLYQRRLSLIGG